MLYTVLHRGVPIGTTEADDPRALSVVMVRQLAGFEALRAAVPQLLLFIQFDPTGAPVGASLRPARRAGPGAADG